MMKISPPIKKLNYQSVHLKLRVAPKPKSAAWLALSFLVISSGCSADDAYGTYSEQEGLTSNPIPGWSTSRKNPTSTARKFAVDVLLYDGDGAWQPEVESLENILTSHGASYRKVSEDEINTLSVDQLASFGVILFPGGSGGTQSDSLSETTRARIRAAVQEHGTGYVGFCAGAFIAVAPTPPAGRDFDYGIGVVNGPILDYYYLEDEGVDSAMTLTKFKDGTQRDLLWYGGPITPRGAETIIAKYPNGDPAISQMWSGKGLVVLSGPHPGAPQWVKSEFGLEDSDGEDYDLAWKLIDAALHQRPLRAF